MNKDNVFVLGPQGTFSEIAAKKLFNGSDLIYARTIRDVFEHVSSEGGYGVVPFENSLEGSVNQTLDSLIEYSFNIVSETSFDIHLCLAAKKPEIKFPGAILSHPHALAQCRRYLEDKFPGVSLTNTQSTVSALCMARDNPNLLAVGPCESARSQGLFILDEDIEDYPSRTRFIAVSKDASIGKKSSVLFALPNEPGALYLVLEIFYVNGINLTKIESRPSKRGLGDYIFFADLENPPVESTLENAFSSLRERTTYFRFLGSYAVF